jgi:dephospho-CoA kinase
MLRVGLTGGLGSGKSTVAAVLRECGAHVIEADSVGRALMQPGQPVYEAIVARFGIQIVREDGTLDRRALADLAFQQGRARELSFIVHPAVVAAQNQWMDALFAENPGAVAVVESALIFEAERDGTAPGWRERFDSVILVTAPRELRIARFLARNRVQANQEALRADAEARIASQIPDEEKIPLCDFVIDNSASLEDARKAAQQVWDQLAVRTLTHERDVS